MINIQKLRKSFHNRVILDNLNLQIKQKELLVILGASGSGKSVLLKHIIGLIKPDSGNIFVDNQDMTLLKGKELYTKLKSFGMIFQHGALFDSFTLEENVAFYLKQHGTIRSKKITPSDITKIVDQSLESVGLKGTNKMLPSEISGGMKKRAAIARSISYQPDYLLYDEPTSGLDPTTAKNIADLILKQHKVLGITSLVVSHDMYTTMNIADRIAFIENGRIEIEGTPKEFAKNPHPSIKIFNEVTKGWHGNKT